jgi:hypothetical protein
MLMSTLFLTLVHRISNLATQVSSLEFGTVISAVPHQVGGLGFCLAFPATGSGPADSSSAL